MKTALKDKFNSNHTGAAFTLIELLVVIGIIAILAAMILSVGSMVGQKKIIARAQGQMHKLQTAIEAYKSRMGFYPPSTVNSLADRTNSVITANRSARNTLFYELTGVLFGARGQNNVIGYTNVLGEELTSIQINAFLAVTGFANSGTSMDEIRNFYQHVSLDELGNINPSINPPVRVFALPADGPLSFRSPEPSGRQRWLVPWCYDSSSTNRINADSYDLWIDIVVGGKTNRICNWSDSPLIL